MTSFSFVSRSRSGDRALYMTRRWRACTGAFFAFTAVAPSSSATLPAHPQQAPPPPALPAKTVPAKGPAASAYTQGVRGANGTVQAVQTAIRRFEPVSGTGPTVYLVAATHIGEKAYYHQLQQFLGKQDVVLFEMVKPPTARKTPAAPPGTAPTDTMKGKPTTAPANLQKKLSEVLNLQFQLEAINYKQPNFRNSDLAWDDLEAMAAQSGEGAKKSLLELSDTINGGPNAGLAGTALSGMVRQASSNPSFAKLFRRAIVELVADPDKLASLRQQQSADQVKLQNILITERNKVVLADLKAIMETAKMTPKKTVRSIAVFYGSEHMRDLGQHLVSDLGYRVAGTQWVTAINATR